MKSFLNSLKYFWLDFWPFIIIVTIMGSLITFVIRNEINRVEEIDNILSTKGIIYQNDTLKIIHYDANQNVFVLSNNYVIPESEIHKPYFKILK